MNMHALSQFLQEYQRFVNLPFALVIFAGCMWVLYSSHYSLSGNKIPIWHRAPLVLVAMGAAWVATTCMASIFSNSQSDMSYWRVGVLGELVINAGLSMIVVCFIVQAVRRAKPKTGTKKGKS